MTDIYPHAPGHRGVDTSIAAAAGMSSSIGRLQRIVLRAIADAGPIGRSTNELAEQLTLDRCSIQPRTSELRSKRLIADSGQRRCNANGKRAIVWTTPDHVDSIGEERG